MKLRRATLSLAAAALAVPGCARPQAVPGGVYLAKNNSSKTLKCRSRIDDGAWSAYFKLKPGAEFTQRGDSHIQSVLFFCDPPMARVAYPLERGERYSILPGANGGLELRHVTAHIGGG